MFAKDVPAGSLVEYEGIRAWCLGHIQIPSYVNSVLLGWKPGEVLKPGTWSPAIMGNPAVLKILETAGCERGYWLLPYEELNVIKQASVALTYATVVVGDRSGMACRLCKEYAPYAVPNRADGKSFICYSCSRGWIPQGM